MFHITRGVSASPRMAVTWWRVASNSNTKYIVDIAPAFTDFETFVAVQTAAKPEQLADISTDI